MASVKSFFVWDMLLLLLLRSPNKYLSKKVPNGSEIFSFFQKRFVIHIKLSYIICTVEQYQ